MKILRVCYEYPPPWDGLTPGPFELSVAQVKQGHEIFYICGGNEKKISIKGIHIISVGESAPIYLFGPYFSVSIKVIPVIIKIVRKYNIDVIHIHGQMAFWFNLLKLIGMFKKIPYVYHVHSSGAKYFLDLWTKVAWRLKFKGLFVWPLYYLQDKITTIVADKIICVSKRDAAIFKNVYKCDENKTAVIENGVNTDLFSRDNKNKIDNKNIIKFIFVGIVSPRKNIEKMLYFLSGINKYITSHLTIVGQGEIDYINSLKALANNLGIKENIKWIGYIEYPELPKIYKNNDILLLFSYSEGMPKVVLEALSCGLRVFSSKSFNTETLLNDLVDWFNIDDNIKNIINTFVHSIKNSKNNDRYFSFRNDYSWDKKASEIDIVYKKLKKY